MQLRWETARKYDTRANDGLSERGSFTDQRRPTPLPQPYGWRATIMSSRSAPVEIIVTGTPQTSSSRAR